MAKYSRKTNYITVKLEDGRTKKYYVSRVKETADEGGWYAEELGDFYTLKSLKAEAIDDCEQYG